MRPLRALVIYIAVVFLGGALLAPWLYWLSQNLAHFLPKLAGAPFHRFVNRSLLIVALAGLWPLLRALGAASLHDVGLVKPGGQWKKLGGGFALGFISLAAVAVLALAMGARQINESLTAGPLAGKLAGAALSAVVVSLVEEILFRGGIFGGLRRIFSWPFALVLSSMIYAIVHFLERADLEGAITWTSGFHVLFQMLGGFADWQQIVPGFFNLTLAGVLLGMAYQRTGNLYLSMGLHAGWIFWLKSYGALTVKVAHANTWLWGTEKLIDGWLAMAVLAATLLAYAQWSAGKNKDLLA
jgi:membrane protease YdiL (CAAX protease family)